MELALSSTDVSPLSEMQKNAVLAALFTALIADGAPRPEELSKFEEAIGKLPWGISREQLQMRTRAIAERISSADRDGKLAFVAEVAATLPEPALREKIVMSMIAIASADKQITHGERASLSVFLRVFGFDDAQIAKLRDKLSSERVART
jgi:uncharacterized tellurite resistance protein B-like protein